MLCRVHKHPETSSGTAEGEEQQDEPLEEHHQPVPVDETGYRVGEEDQGLAEDRS